MWAQRFRDCFAPERSQPRPDTGRVRVGHYNVPRSSVQSGDWQLPDDCNCELCVQDRGFATSQGAQK